MAKVNPDYPQNPFSFLLRVPVPWVYVLAYLAGIGLERLCFRKGPLADSDFAGIAGGILFVTGVVIAGWGWTIFQQKKTTRVPGEASKALVTWGPYRVTRNPMYVGLALAYMGEAGLLRQVMPLALLPLVLIYVNWVVIPLEEARLHDVFGPVYDEYRSRVRRWL